MVIVGFISLILSIALAILTFIPVFYNQSFLEINDYVGSQIVLGIIFCALAGLTLFFLIKEEIRNFTILTFIASACLAFAPIRILYESNGSKSSPLQQLVSTLKNVESYEDYSSYVTLIEIEYENTSDHTFYTIEGFLTFYDNGVEIQKANLFVHFTCFEKGDKATAEFTFRETEPILYNVNYAALGIKQTLNKAQLDNVSYQREFKNVEVTLK